MNMSAIEYTPEGAVLISYEALVSAPESLGSAIGRFLLPYWNYTPLTFGL
jgi:hypothetical protein